MIIMHSNTDKSKSTVKGSREGGSSNTASNDNEDDRKDRSKSSGSKDGSREPRGRNYFYSSSRGRGDRGKSRGRGREDYGYSRSRYYDDRRGGFRGRYSRRGRDDDSYDHRSRFQDSMNKSRSDSIVSSNSKLYTGSDHRNKPDIAEDSRISTTLRRMAREDDEIIFNNLCYHLQNSLTLADNEVYIRRFLDTIDESLLDMIRYCQKDSFRLNVAKCIGHVGYNIGKDFRRYMDWIFRKINNENSAKTREYLLKGIYELALLDSGNPKLGDHSKNLNKELHMIMESTDIADIYILTAETILILTKQYPYHFAEFFHDTIDIIVGWHIDSSQPGHVADFSSDCLRSLSEYWIQDIQFTVSLLTQILEDAQMYSDEVSEEHSPSPSDEAFSKATNFIRVFRAVFEGAKEAMDPSICKKITWTFHSDAISQIFNIVLKMIDVHIYCPVICAGNYCALAIMKYLKYKTNTVQTTLFKYISKQLDIGKELDADTVESFLTLMAKVIGESGFQLSVDLVDRLFSSTSLILTNRFTPLRPQLIALYQALIKRKDVVLIKCAFRHMITDLSGALKVLFPKMDSLRSDITVDTQADYQPDNVETIIKFYFDTFQTISITGGALFWVYLVKPSLFDLFAVKLVHLFSPLEYPSLFHSVVVLLKSHCSTYGEFVHTSKLLVDSGQEYEKSMIRDGQDSPKHSPTSDHLSIIMKLVGSLLKMVMSEDTKLVLLLWAKDIFSNIKSHYTSLSETEEFSLLVTGIARSALDRCRKVALAAAKCIYLFVDHFNQTWKMEYLIKIMGLCTTYVNSASKKLQAIYLRILKLLPSLTVVFGVQHYCKDPRGYRRNLESCLYASLTRGDTGEIQDVHFRKIMEYIFHGHYKQKYSQRFDNGWIEDIVSRCWAVLEFDLGQRTMSSERALMEWAAWQCANLTVNQRLKTPLGKPAETLISIENVINELSKEVTSGKRSEVWRTPMTGQRVRLLVQFIEHLEKLIYNSVDGTAYAFPAPQSAVKSFFMTNKGTCVEWLNRVRLALMFVCLHAGLASYTVRHGEAYLQHLLDNNNTQGWEFSTALTYIAWALSNLGESEAVLGLYVWAKEYGVKMSAFKPLALKAAHRYEEAVDGFQKLVSSPPEDELSQDSAVDSKLPSNSRRTFIADHLTESYMALNNWEELSKWKQIEKNYLNYDNGNSFQLHKYLTEDYANAMKLLGQAEKEAASKLIKWSDSAFNCPMWNHYNAVYSINHDLTKTEFICNSVEFIDDSFRKVLKERVKACRQFLDEIIKESLKESTSELFSMATVLKYAAASIYTDFNHLDNQVNELGKSIKRKLRNPEMSLILLWSSLLSDMPRKTTSASQSTDFNLMLSKVARKEGNLNLARVCLLRYFWSEKSLKSNLSMTLHQIADSIISCDEYGCSPDKLAALDQLTKLLKRNKEDTKACHIIVEKIKLSSGQDEMKAKSLVNLSNWIQQTSTVVNSSELIELLDKNNILIELSRNDSIKNDFSGYFEESTLLSESDLIVKSLLKSSICIWPGMAKAWSSLAQASYSWARSLASDNSRQPVIDETNLPCGIEAQVISNLISSTPPTIHLDDIDVEASVGVESFEMHLSEFHQITDEERSNLISEWRKFHAPIYNYFSLSAYSYFKYLQTYSDKDCVVLATLRLVRLLVKHPEEMELLYQTHMSETPTSPWICIVPQLFSRLSHLHPYPRKKIAELLVRIGTDYPHLISFPAVVGSKTGVSTIKDMPNTNLFATYQNIDENSGTKDEELDEEIGFFADEEEQENYDDDDTNNKDESTTILENSFITIVDSLSKQCGGSMLNEVGVLVSELRRITVLWDELWLGTLKHRHADTTRRFNRLTAETEVTLSNQHLSQDTKDSLIRQKHSLILKPLLFVLEQLHSITSVPPETPHEQRFQDDYGEVIEETLKALRDPANPHKPDEACSAVKRLEKVLSGGSEGKPSVYSMAEISPVLAGFKDTCIAMPGLDRPSVTIRSVQDTVQVLATMTKPKKLVFVGSDGKEYTYLFKGLEDLHLDERIMQFLSTANALLKDESLRARHYSVVPLGPRSGLISWVDSVTPIFSIYKRWQLREQQPNSKTWFGIPRPSELYYSVLSPLLTEAGLKADPSHRSTWPLFLLKKALSLLTKQTPNHLLSKEIWCYSGSGGSWWESTKLYATSLGVMSMIGYIIGLGDRHLDNVMVNLRTGQVVHIDYNVCFEKGKTLRIPEKVPFRLTPNLVTALGITGIEGLFRSTCEKVLQVLQKEKETLLTLLEAFVYDPLIDWTPLNETGYTGAVYGGGRGLGQEIKQTRRQLERQVTLAMFSVRVVEISHQWRLNKEKVRSELSMFIKLIKQWLTTNEDLNNIMSKLQERHSQMALLKEAEGQPNHPLYTLGSRFEAYSSVFTSKQQVVSSLTAKLHEADLLISHYQSVTEVLRSQELTKYLRELNTRPKKDLCTVFDLIKEFLQNAGQKQMVLQCAESERQMCQIAEEQNDLTASLIELLTQYWEIAKNYPASYIHNHRSSLYKKWSMMLLEELTPQKCAQVEYEMSRELCLREETMVSLSRYYSDLVRLAETASAEAMRPLPMLPNISKEQPVTRQSLANYTDVQIVAAVCKALVSTNSKFLRLESAATGAGDYLVNLMSREGNWFLEDMVTLSSIVQDLLTLLPPSQPDTSMHRICKTLTAIHSQYKALQEMDLNVRGIILFEAMQAMRCEEPTVILAGSVLENLALSADSSLASLAETLLVKLKVLLSSNSKVTDDESEGIALRLEEGFSSIMSSLDSTSLLTPGQMLLLGFNGLFSDLEMNICSVAKLFSSLHLPALYHCIDHIADSKQYPVELTSNERCLNILSQYLSVCHIQAMVETLGACSMDAEGWRTGSLPPGDPAVLARPVRSYIANYVRSCLLGLLPRTVALAVTTLLSDQGLDIEKIIRSEDGAIPNRISIDEFCNKFIEVKLGESLPVQLVKLVEHRTLETRHHEVLRIKEREASQARASLARQTLLTTTFHWLHEHYLLASPPPPINRSHFMLEVRKTMSSLLNLQSKINEAVEQQQALINSSEQRLRWASGANPALTEVLSAFENSVTVHRQRLIEDQRRAVQVSNFANWVLQYEALRTPTNEALNNDTAFALLVKECSKAYFIREQNQVTITSVEEGLVTLSPPPHVINHQWISTSEELVSDSIRNLNKDLEPLQKEMFAADDCVKNASLTIRYEMGTHNKIVSDIRELFKTMIKFEDAKEIGLEDYLVRYKEYTDKMSRMTKWFTTHEPISEKKLKEALDTCLELLSLTDDIYEDLMKLTFSESPKELPAQMDAKNRRQRTLTHTKSVQEKNSYAVGVWRRIKLKLEGRDPDPGVTSTISQQVNWTINDAMSFENLATLYEGWTPWV